MLLSNLRASQNYQLCSAAASSNYITIASYRSFHAAVTVLLSVMALSLRNCTCNDTAYQFPLETVACQVKNNCYVLMPIDRI